jgi:cation/acetate symporter
MGHAGRSDLDLPLPVPVPRLVLHPGHGNAHRGQYLFGIPPTHFGPIGALFNFGVAYLVSNATAAPPKEIQDLVESVRIPRGAGAAVDH